MKLPVFGSSAAFAVVLGLLSTLVSPAHSASTNPPGVDVNEAWERIGYDAIGRWGHSAIHDDANARIIVFGGMARDGRTNDVWALTLGPTPAWTLVHPAGTAPSPRRDHVAVYDPANQRMIVFGGDDGALRSDVWQLTLGAAPAWTLLAPTGVAPTARREHSAIWDPSAGGRMIVFGGSDAPTTYRNDVWSLSLSGAPAWSLVTTTGTPPVGRAGHSAIRDPVAGRMIVFGGFSGTLRNDTWSLTLGGSPAWLAISASAPPSARRSHAAIYDPSGHVMIVFGGNHGSLSSGVYALTLSTPSWSTVGTGTAPVAREQHAVVRDPAGQRMIVIGGADPQIRGDVAALPLTGSKIWEALVPAGTSPSGRADLQAIYDPSGQRLVLFGGDESFGSSSRRNDTWTFDVEGDDGWVRLAPTGSPPTPRSCYSAIHDPVNGRMIVFGGSAAALSNEVWALGLSGAPAWQQVLPSGAPPPARWHHSAIYDPVNGRMIVFGGRSASAPLNDVWALELDGTPAWIPLSPTGTRPSPRYVHSAVYDSANGGRMIVFGGLGPSHLNDVWALSLNGAPAWTPIMPSGTPPSARDDHEAIYSRGRMLVFGGNAPSDPYSRELWELTLGPTPAWQQLTPPGNAPEGRYAHTALNDEHNGRMVVLGGRASTSNAVMNDVWALEIDPCEPSIVHQPSSYQAVVGGEAGFSVIATGAPPLSYQWYRGFSGTGFVPVAGPDVVGATTPTLLISNLQTCSGIAYRCEVTNGCGSVTSALAYVDVQPRSPAPDVVSMWGSLGSAPGQFDGPRALALDREDHVYVADAANDRVQKFTPTGAFVLEWGASGSAPGQFDDPGGLAVNAEGAVYVVDTGNHRVLKFTPAGEFLTQWGGLGSGPGQFDQPHHAAIDQAGNVYVTDTGNGRVQKFDSEGNYVRQFAVSALLGLTVDPSGNVYTSSTGVFKYDSLGNFITSWGAIAGCADGQVFGSHGLSSDSCGNIYTSDNNRVQMFTGDGAFLRNWGGPGDDERRMPGTFVQLRDVAVGGTGRVVTADAGLHRVTAFQQSPIASCDSTCADAPPIQISSHPANRTVAPGDEVSFGVAASGPGEIVYRWYHDGVLVNDDASHSGAYTPGLTIRHVDASHAGLYQVVVFNGCDTTAAQDAILAVECAGVAAPAPPQLQAWWTFDDPAPATSHRDLAHDGTGINQGMPLSGATQVAGRVGKALQCLGAFDGMQVSTPSSIALGREGFAADAWIYLRPGSPAGATRMIVMKQRVSDVSRFQFFVRDGRLGVGLRWSSPIEFLTAPIVTTGAWHHVAVLVNSPRGQGELYVNGVVARTFVVPMNLVVNNNASLYVGRFDATFGAYTADSAFHGEIDELQIFRPSVLGSDSSIVRRIWAAGCAGKRREFVRLPAVASLCANGRVTTVCARISNFLATAQTYSFAFEGLPPGASCMVSSPLVFTPSAGSVTVPPGGTVTLASRIEFGSGSASNACYRMRLTSLSSGVTSTTDGRITRSSSVFCAYPPNVCQPPEAPGLATRAGARARSVERNAVSAVQQTATFVVANDSVGALPFDYRIEARDSETDQASDGIRLDGLTVGEALTSSVVIPPSDSIEIVVDIEHAASSPLLNDQIVLFADADGDAVLDPLAAVLVEGLEDTSTVVVGAGEVPPRITTGIDAAPNPFRDRTTVRFAIAETREVVAGVFDVTGRRVATLHHGVLAAGAHRLEWDGRDARGRRCGAGIYFVRIESGTLRLQTKVVPLR